MGEAIGLRESVEDHRGGGEFAFQSSLRCMIDDYVALWATAGAARPDLQESYNSKEQQKNEREVDRLMRYLQEEFSEFPDSAPEQATWRRRVLREVRRAAAKGLGYPERLLRISDAYLHHMEGYSPCRFGYLRDQDARTEERLSSLEATLLHNKNLHSIVDLIG